MKPKIKFVAVFFFVLAGLCLNAYSSYAFPGSHGRGGEIRHLKWILAKGGQPLTDTQKAQIKDIMKASWTQLKPTILQLKTDRQALRALIISGAATNDQVTTQGDAMVPLRTAIAEQRALIFNQIVTQVLTDAQRSVLQNFKGPATQ